MELETILQAAVQGHASDVLLKDGKPPMFRLRGELMPMPDAGPLTASELQEALTLLLRDDAHRMRFVSEHHADFAFEEPGIGRFRLNVYRQRGKVGIVMRVIPASIRGFADLGLPPVVERIVAERRGLILVTGPTGSGKTTTLAAMTDQINRASARHIITIEDPIEYVHQDQRSVVSQREIGVDVSDFPSALRVALRQNPDVIMLGEMRDLPTIETAILAAETGHLVMTTLHTIDAPETVHRIVTAFPEHQRDQVRGILANVIKAVISQRLVPTADGKGVTPAVEIMVSTARVREYIDKGRIRDLREVIAQGQTAYGMQTFDQSLLDLCQAGRITQDDAIAQCTNPSDFALLLQGISSAFTSRTPAAEA